MKTKISIFISFSIIFIVLLVGNKNFASAEEKSYFLTSKTLLTYCQSSLPLEDGICQGYLAGIADSIYSGHQSNFVAICIPKGINSSDLKKIFVEYATNFPEFFERAADGLITDAYARKFSC